MIRTRRSWFRVPVLFFLNLFGGCFTATPFQSARTTEPGEQNGTVSVQRSIEPESNNDHSWYLAEFTSRNPLVAGRADWSINGAIMAFESRGEITGAGAMFGMGMKFELLDDVLAVEIPARIIFAGEATLATTHIYPRAILSIPLGSHLEVNLSHTRYYYGEEHGSFPYGFGAGLAIGRRGGSVIRPEIGVINYPYDEQVVQCGIAWSPAGPVYREPDGEAVTPH